MNNWFHELSSEDQVHFLVALANELTVTTRFFYGIPDGLTDMDSVRILNEIQHRVTAHARNIISDPLEGQFPMAYGVIDDLPNVSPLAKLIPNAIHHARLVLERNVEIA
jgi:hypothetical protein